MNLAVFGLSSLLLNLVFVSTPVWAAERSECGDLNRPGVPSDVPCLVAELVSKSFPKLESAWKEGRIELRDFDSDEYFFRSCIVRGSLRSSQSRHYSIDVNPKVFHTFLPVLPRPSLQALRGVLAHELVHLEQFETSSSWGLARILKEVTTQKVKHERSIDVGAFERGFAEDLLQYRLWQYTRLEGSALSKKQREYFTPEEIQEWILENDLARPKH